jgi:aspartate/methionine/tyrosine aminotransferase
MGGFRVGYAIGNRELIQGLRQVKAAVDFNQYRGILQGSATVLRGNQTFVQQSLEVYRQRRDTCVAALQEIGWAIPTPKATMYLWAPLPSTFTSSLDFCLQLVQKTGVALAPGSGFGSEGEGYVRFALVVDPGLLKVAVEQIGEFLTDFL